MTGESDKSETGASDAEETACPDANPRTTADKAAKDTESIDSTTNSETAGAEPRDGVGASADDVVPEGVQGYARPKRVDDAQYDHVDDSLHERIYVTAREWAITRLYADFRTGTGVKVTKIGNSLPELVPFITDTHTLQTVDQARSVLRDKARKSGATFLYGAMSGFFTVEELDKTVYEMTEIAKFLLEVEGIDFLVEEELEAGERVSSVTRGVREASTELRQEELSDEGWHPVVRAIPWLRPRIDVAPTRSQGRGRFGFDWTNSARRSTSTGQA